MQKNSPINYYIKCEYVVIKIIFIILIIVLYTIECLIIDHCRLIFRSFFPAVDLIRTGQLLDFDNQKWKKNSLVKSL